MYSFSHRMDQRPLISVLCLRQRLCTQANFSSFSFFHLFSVSWIESSFQNANPVAPALSPTFFTSAYDGPNGFYVLKIMTEFFDMIITLSIDSSLPRPEGLSQAVPSSRNALPAFLCLTSLRTKATAQSWERAWKQKPAGGLTRMVSFASRGEEATFQCQIRGMNKLCGADVGQGVSS